MSKQTVTAKAGPSGADAPPTPARVLGRFRLGRLLGQGGMGQVYEAYDPHLKRSVAVKLLLRGQVADIRRFVREARSQAAQTHPDICPVYEAGEVDGTPYIVMKRIYGVPLDEATAEMSLEGKLRLVRRIAEAVHAAHRTGLVHRDLKPGNVLVEPATDGEDKPYVLDFGLARSVADSGAVTADGEAMGTPGYMAPEQLRGKGPALDRRTDVYALGATLYHLLAGSPPFSGSGITVLRAVEDRDPSPLRPLGVPRDVEAILFKCLEKEPERRYPSAHALADDLQRYLDDVPVRARPNNGWYRLLKWGRRNRALLRISILFSLSLLAALSWGGVTAWQARERERVTRHFTEQVEEIEALARYSHMAPLHDVRSDRDLLRQRMEGIREAMKSGSRITRTAAHHALGRGYLALEAYQDAYRELHTAWDAGYRRPETAAALARTLSALYREALSSAELLSDWESRQRRLRQLEDQYGEPARDFLAQSSEGAAAQAADPPYLAALALFHGGRFEGALAVLADTEARRPWSYELDALEGDIRRSLAIRLHAEDDRARATAELERALEAYDRARVIAPSYPAIGRAASQVAVLYGEWKELTGEDLRPVLDRGLESVSRSLGADPGDARTWLWQARLHRLVAQGQRLRSEEPTARLAEAAAAAQRAASLLTEPSEAYRELARIRWGEAQWQRQQGRDPKTALDATVTALDQVAPAWRDYTYYTALGAAHMTLGDHRSDGGQEAASSFDRAIAAYRAATRHHSEPFGALSNLGVCLFKKSGLPSTGDRLLVLREAVAVFEEAQKLSPRHVAPPYYLGQCHLRIAQGGHPASGLLDEDSVRLAVESYQRAIELNPRMVVLHNVLGEAYHLQGVHAWERGEDAEPFFVRAREAYAAGLAEAPRHAFFHQNLAWTAYFQGKARLRSGRDPGPYLDEALGHARRALELATRPGAILCVGSTYRLKAEAAVRAGKDPAAWIERSRQAFQQLLKLNPRHAEAHRSVGRLLTLEGRWRTRKGDDPEVAFRRARRALDLALELEPTVAYFHLARARWALERDRWTPSPEVLEQGLADVKAAARLRPDWVEVPEVLNAIRDRLGGKH